MGKQRNDIYEDVKMADLANHKQVEFAFTTKVCNSGTTPKSTTVTPCTNSVDEHLLITQDMMLLRSENFIKGTASNSSKSMSNRNDLAIKEEMGRLREHVLLWNAFKFVIIPTIVIALFSSFFPFAQALVPVHEADSCICIFL